MSLNRHAKKRDDVEREIIRVWERHGAYVEPLGGTGLPDALVHHYGRIYRAEIKGAKRGLTPAQVEAFTRAVRAGVETFIVRTAEDARDMLYNDCRAWRPEDGALAGVVRKKREFRPGRDKARTVAELCEEFGCTSSHLPGWRRCAAHLADMVMP